MQVKYFETLLLRGLWRWRKVKCKLNVSLFKSYFVLTLLENVKTNQLFFVEMPALPVRLKVTLDML